MHQRSRNEIIGYLLGVLAIVLFAGTLPFTRLALTGYSPWFITFGRAAIAALLSITLLALLRRPFPRSHAAPLMVAGVMLCVGFPGLMAIALQTVPSSHGGVVLGILPLLTALFAAVLDGDRRSPLFWFCAISGGVLVALFAVRDSGFTASYGDIVLFAACVCASIGYVISGKLTRYMTGWEVISWALIFAAPISVSGAVWAWEPRFINAPLPALISLGYLSVISMYLAFFAWNIAMAKGGIARIGQIQLLQTFITLIIANRLLGEKIGWDAFGFAFAVALLVYISQHEHIQKRPQ